jgi:CYTH domain-containing protein
MKREIERKFVLKDLPVQPYILMTEGLFPRIEVQDITQYYYLVGDVWYRIREIDSNLSKSNTYLHTIKTYKDGICYEEESDYTYSEFKLLMNEIHSGKYECTAIRKTRYIYTTDIEANFDGEIKKLKWEIDVFNFNLVVAEIEIPELDYPVEIPDYIKSKLIYEVTGIPEFSNRNLSEPLKLS